MYIPKLLKPRLRGDLNCFPDTNIESLRVAFQIYHTVLKKNL